MFGNFNGTEPRTRESILRAQKSEDLSSMYEELSSLFDKAEKSMKCIEHSEGLFIPTVNQLRYAGWHTKNFLVNHNTEELEKAKRHCQRAIYDACDARIQYCLKEIKDFNDDFPLTTKTEDFPEYLDMMKYQTETLKFLNDTKDNHSNSDALYIESQKASEELDKGLRWNFYKECEEKTQKLEAFISNLPHVREELNKRTNQIIKNQKNNIAMLVITIISIIVAALK